MNLRDLDYHLPEDLIAQRPAGRREDARLLVVRRADGALVDAHVARLGEWLTAGDVLVLNETRVRPARLVVRRPTGGAVELLVVRPAPDGTWVALARPAKRAHVGVRLALPDGSLTLEVVGEGDGGERRLQVASGDLEGALRAAGEIPLPPYIRRAATPEDAERYQTVFARVEGAVAAPTAGLHFSEALLAGLAARGVDAVRLVLHVGPGTFRPVSSDDPREHRMEEEWYDVPADTAARLRAARAAGGRVVAVGTTAVRALESACDAHGGALGPASGWTRKYILPPYRFRGVDALLTNFHLPRTTLLLLVAAFAGAELVRAAYAHAVRERYRFYSYGDAMLIL
uniref:S-adenosylmethionine:tRNA ribosyltransferase-isomerase n=1 Tax=Eiseniibacteriota bacterium TaxID=2212470 RepID=A0A832I071_UNCEI